MMRASTPITPLAGASTIAALWGGLGVAYTAVFEGEPHAPGLLVGLLLGFWGTLVGAFTWATWWGLSATGTAGPRERRALASTFGRSWRVGLVADLRDAGRTAALALAWGTAGGLAATLGWAALDGRWSLVGNWYDVASVTSYAVLVVQAVAWGVLGYALGLVLRTVERVLAVVAVVGLITIGLLGLAYFNPAFGPAVAVSPLALPLVVVGGTAGPFVALPSLTTAALTAAAWAVVVGVAMARAARRPLLDG